MMLTPDELPIWFGVPLAIVLWVWFIVDSIRRATPDPHPEYSELDKKDGLGSLLDVTG